MSTWVTVFLKELLDYARDRRTLLTSLLIGPLFGPLLFGFVLNFSIERQLSSAREVTEVPVIGAANAPNLVRYLESRNIDAIVGPVDLEAAKAAVSDGTHDVVLIVPEDFGERLKAGHPARIELVSDQANTDGERETRRLRTALAA